MGYSLLVVGCVLLVGCCVLLGCCCLLVAVVVAFSVLGVVCRALVVARC